jgi:rubredoxin
MHMFNRGLILFLPVFFFMGSQAVKAQTRRVPANGPDTIGWLSPGEMNRVLNDAFSNLVTSNKNPGEIASNASLDPVAATFSLKASFPFKTLVKNKKDSTEDQKRRSKGRFSYLGFTVTGNLLDKSYATLFSKGALNSGINAQAQYNFRIGGQHFVLAAVDEGEVVLKRHLLSQSYDRKSETLDQTYSADNYNYSANVLQKQVDAAQERLALAQDSSNLMLRTMDSLHWQIQGKPELADRLAAVRKKLADQRQALSKAQDALDSLQFAGAHDWGAEWTSKHNAMVKQKPKDRDSILATTNFLQLSTTWCTLTSGIGKKSFYTFDPTQPFASQVNSNSLVTYNFGFGINYINIDKLRKHTFFLSSTISYLRDNNLASLSTSELDQTKKTANAGGDTTRMVTTKFNVYTGPITTFLATNWTAQTYYIWGKQPMGVHLSPSVTFEDDGLTLSNLTVGFIFGFKTSTKDQPVLNTEFYVTGVDVFNQQKATDGLWKRSQIGLSFTVPVDLFMK